jgi:hypothetical protein
MNSTSNIRGIRIEAAKFLALAGALLLLAPANSVEAQFTYSAINGGICIKSYTGAGGAVRVPSTINGLPVTSLETNAFDNAINVTSVALPDSVINIGAGAFGGCANLTEVTLGSGVTNIGTFPVAASGPSGFTIPNDITNLGNGVFGFSALTNVTVPYGVTNIGSSEFYLHFVRTGAKSAGNGVTIGGGAFASCVMLSNLEIHNSVASIGDGAFYFCTSLKAIHFIGDAPSVGHNAFALDEALIYYLPGTTGWSSNFADLPTAPWTPSNPEILTSSPTFGAQNHAFGFTILGRDNAGVVVQTCTNLTNPTWTALATVTLSGGRTYFSDPDWADDSIRFYRLAPP